MVLEINFWKLESSKIAGNFTVREREGGLAPMSLNFRNISRSFFHLSSDVHSSFIVPLLRNVENQDS